MKTFSNEQIAAILQSTIDDLVVLGSGTDFDFDDYDARAIAKLSDVLTHKQKFFIANRRINQLSRLVDALSTPKDPTEHLSF